MSYKAYLALGSNLGDRKQNLKLAIDYISKLRETELGRISAIYETKPVGFKEQGDFLNMVISVETKLEPLSLLKETQNIENVLQRKREIRWGPRTIDVDILMYRGKAMETPELTIPHPRMFERAFVLIPLKDVLEENEQKEMKIETLIGKCDDRTGVKRYCES